MLDSLNRGLRTILEQRTRRWRFRRSLPPDLGKASIMVSPSCGLRFLFRPMEQIDPALLAIARTEVCRGQKVWDVGANVGLFAVAAAAKSGPEGAVMALEPDPWLADMLQETASGLPDSFARVDVLSLAVASAISVRRFHLARRSRGCNFLDGYGLSQTGGSRNEIAVAAVTLDWLEAEFGRPNLIKIDVEGAELEVLTGGEHVLSGSRPTLLVEVEEESADAVTEFLVSRDYDLFDAEVQPAARNPLSRACWNTLARPRGAVMQK